MSYSINIKVLPDGSGRVRIHWFERRPQGPIRTALAAFPLEQVGLVQLGGAVGRIACMPNRKDVQPDWKGNEVTPLCHTDDPRAATCPECMATPEFRAAMAPFEEAAAPAQKEAQNAGRNVSPQPQPAG